LLDKVEAMLLRLEQINEKDRDLIVVVDVIGCFNLK
jgi:hypothetical protein